jgi:hypothetical protein
MDRILSIDSIGVFVLLVFPGAVSLQVYRLIMPSRPIQWSEISVSGLFYSLVNYCLLFPGVLYVANTDHLATHPTAYWLVVFLLLVVGPIAWPIGLRAILASTWVQRHVQLPWPTAWDFFFGKRRPCFALLTLNDGEKLGGYWGDRSYATSFPNDGELYLETVVEVNEDGTFGDALEGSAGLLIRRDRCRYIELFELPDSEEDADVKGPSTIQEGLRLPADE